MPDGQVVDASPIINDPFDEPNQHWHFGSGKPVVRTGRRISGFLPPSSDGVLSITSDIIPLPLVNDLRIRVRQWRQGGYQGVTSVTRDLFDRWFDDERETGTRPFFAQREAFETIVFLTEAPPEKRVGVLIPITESYPRWAVKMATGAGKTLVMAMAITWSVLNKATRPQDARFAEAVLVVCPNLTIKQRLASLNPHERLNEYQAFGLIPPNLTSLMGQARVMVTNWHQLLPDTDPKRSVMHRGPESDAAFCRRVIEPDLGRKHNLLVINDEAHHAYRRVPTSKVSDADEETERATVWIDALARVHAERGLLRCLDFSATPMFVPGSGHAPWTPFPWIVSDFALVDAIESGLVKIPRIPTDDNAGAAVPKYRDLWEHLKQALPGARDGDQAGGALTDYLIQADGPLRQLAGEWQETLHRWEAEHRAVPPVMIIVCRDTRMAEVLDVYIGTQGKVSPELQNSPSYQRTVRIDSRLLAQAETRDEIKGEDAAERVRMIAATVGKLGQPGERVRCLISVAMLSEGWDARNVTQILGLRAFDSQLLCEQVVGRGLRRSSYDDLTIPEYVDIYGVPFQLLPFAKASDRTRVDPPRTTSVLALREREALEITFPRLSNIVYDVGTLLEVAYDEIPTIVVDPAQDPTVTRVSGLAPTTVNIQDHGAIWKGYRRNRLLFELAGRVIGGQTETAVLFPQALAAVGQVLDTKVTLAPGVPEGELDNELYKSRIVDVIRNALRATQGGSRLLPVLDEYEPMGTTATVAFTTAKSVEPTNRSHVNYVVCDSELERGIAKELESDTRVVAYVKNEHLFCEIPYRFDGRTRRYLPDFLVRFSNGRYCLLEGKGQERAKDTAKDSAARRWIAAVNAAGRWGIWSHHIIRHRSEVGPAISAATDVAMRVPANPKQSMKASVADVHQRPSQRD